MGEPQAGLHPHVGHSPRVRAVPAPLRIGLLGCGVVGSAVARLLIESADDLASSIGTKLELGRVAVRDLDKPRPVALPTGSLTADAHAVVADPGIDIVIEVIGGIEPARSFILAAIVSGKSVVTANKELLATHGPELFTAASRHGVELRFEASVCGALPIIRALRESLVGDRIRRVVGIVNGTTNYILSQMTKARCSFDDALARAQTLGFAEADPSADTEGSDAAAKAAILASLAFDVSVTAHDVHREGITNIGAADIETATRLGYVIKLLALAELQHGGVGVRVHPVLLPEEHPLAQVDDEFNGVLVEAESAGRLMFYGPGAGGDPTASAVLGDLVTAARNRLAGVPGSLATPTSKQPLSRLEALESRFLVRFNGRSFGGQADEAARALAGRDIAVHHAVSWEEKTVKEERVHIGVVTEVLRETLLREAVGDLSPAAILRVGDAL